MINDLIICGIYRDLSMNSIQLLCFVAGFPVSYLLPNLLTSTRTITVYYSILKLLCKLCLQYLQSEVQGCIFTSEIVLKSSSRFHSQPHRHNAFYFLPAKLLNFLISLSFSNTGARLNKEIYYTKINFMKTFAKLRRTQSIGIYCFIPCQGQIFCVKCYW